MNDNLHLIIEVINLLNQKLTFYTKIEHGLNSFDNWKYWGEEDVSIIYEEMFGLKEQGFTIIDVRENNGEFTSKFIPLDENKDD